MLHVSNHKGGGHHPSSHPHPIAPTSRADAPYSTPPHPETRYSKHSLCRSSFEENRNYMNLLEGKCSPDANNSGQRRLVGMCNPSHKNNTGDDVQCIFDDDTGDDALKDFECGIGTEHKCQVYPSFGHGRSSQGNPWTECDPGVCGDGWCEANLTSFSSYPMCCDRHKYKGVSLKDNDDGGTWTRYPGYRFNTAPYKGSPDWNVSECRDYDPCTRDSGALGFGLEDEKTKNIICGHQNYCKFPEIAKKDRLMAGMIHDFHSYPYFKIGSLGNERIKMRPIRKLGGELVPDDISEAQEVQIVDTNCNVNDNGICESYYDSDVARENQKTFDVDLEFWTGQQILTGRGIRIGNTDDIGRQTMSNSTYRNNTEKSDLFQTYSHKVPSGYYLPDTSDDLAPDKICIQKPDKHENPQLTESFLKRGFSPLKTHPFGVLNNSPKTR